MGFGKLCALGVLLALVLAVDGSTPLPARPPRASGGFIVNESSITSTSTASTGTGTASGSSKSPATTQPPSFVSVGIRSGCARERAATATTLRNKGVSGTSAASRLRGGSTWIPHPPVKLSRAELEHSQAKTISSTDPVSLHRPTESSSCNSKGGGGGGAPNHHHAAEFTVSKQRVMEDESVEPAAFEDEEDGGGGSGGFGAGAAGGSGGGGGGRVGAPSFPRALKKFAWVP